MWVIPGNKAILQMTLVGVRYHEQNILLDYNRRWLFLEGGVFYNPKLY